MLEDDYWMLFTELNIQPNKVMMLAVSHTFHLINISVYSTVQYSVNKLGLHSEHDHSVLCFILLTWFVFLKIHYEAHSAIVIIKGSVYQDSGLIQDPSVVRTLSSG